MNICHHEAAAAAGDPGPGPGLLPRGGSALRTLPRGLRVGRRHRRLPGGLADHELVLLTRKYCSVLSGK